MDMKPLVSVVMPVYNTAEYLREAIESVRQQTYEWWELILIDDGSTDDSGVVCDEYVAVDTRINAVHTENRGVSCARNTGMDMARGEWIFFIDSDDWLDEKAFERMLFYSDGVDVVMTAMPKMLVDRAGPDEAKIYHLSNISEDDMLELYLLHFEKAVWGKLYRRSCLTERFREGISWGEDTLFNLEQRKKWNRIVWIPECLYNYRSRTGSLSRTISLDCVYSCNEQYRQWSKVYAGCKGILLLCAKVYINQLMQCFLYYINGNAILTHIKLLFQLWLENGGFEDIQILTDKLDEQGVVFWNMVLKKDVDAIYQMMIDHSEKLSERLGLERKMN